MFPAGLGLHVATRFSGPLSKHLLLSFSLTFQLHDLNSGFFFFFFLVAFAENFNSPLFFFQVEFTLGKQSWRQSCCGFLKFVLCVQDTFVNGDVLLALCYLVSGRAVLPAGWKLNNILLDPCWCHLTLKSSLGIIAWSVGQDFAGA